MIAERKSNIVVHKFAVPEDVMVSIKESNSYEPWSDGIPKEKVTLVTRYDLAWAEDKGGRLFVLDSDGVGSQNPVSLSKPVTIPLYGKCVIDGAKTSNSMRPVAYWNVGDPFVIRSLPSEAVNLADFIRAFGRRLEANFNEWNETLSE